MLLAFDIDSKNISSRSVVAIVDVNDAGAFAYDRVSESTYG